MPAVLQQLPALLRQYQSHGDEEELRGVIGRCPCAADAQTKQPQWCTPTDELRYPALEITAVGQLLSCACGF